MRRTARLLSFPMLLLCGTACAALYRCPGAGGVARWTDHPCAADARPAELPPLGTMPALEGADLAAAYDRRQSDAQRRHEEADRAWLKAYEARKAEERKHDREAAAKKKKRDAAPKPVRQRSGKSADAAVKSSKKSSRSKDKDKDEK